MELAGYAETLKEDTNENRQAYQKAVDVFNEATEIFNSSDFLKKSRWKKEAEDEQSGAVVYSQRTDRGKIFCMKTEITANYEVLFLDLFENIDKDHEWNPNIELGKRITWLGDQSDIAYHAMSDFWILKGRDMLAARIWRKLGDSIMMAGRSVEYSLAPLVVNKIRSITFYPHVPISGSGLKKAETSLASGRFSMVQNRPDKCLVEYLICCDLKGWIPKPLTDAVMGKLLLSDAANLRKRAQQTASTQ